MAPAVEIALAPVSDAFRKDPSLINSVAEKVLAAGALGAYAGIDIETNSTLWLVIVWDKVEDHHVLMKDTVIYPQLITALSESISGPVDMYHISLEGPALASALNAPVTAFSHVLTFQEGKDGAALTELVKPVLEQPAEGYGVSFGKVLERDEYVFASGWDSAEEHNKLTAEDPKHVAFAAKIKEFVANGRQTHVPLKAVIKKYE